MVLKMIFYDKQTVLYVVVGLPGSGKSYWAKSFNCPIISSDAIRKELSSSEDDQSINGFL